MKYGSLYLFWKKSNIMTSKILFHLKSNLFSMLREVSLLIQWFLSKDMKNFQLNILTGPCILSPYSS